MDVCVGRLHIFLNGLQPSHFLPLLHYVYTALALGPNTIGECAFDQSVISQPFFNVRWSQFHAQS